MIEIFGLGEYDRQRRASVAAGRDGDSVPMMRPVWETFRSRITFPHPPPEFRTLRMLAEEAETLRPRPRHPPVEVRVDGERWVVVRVGVTERSPMGAPSGATDVEVIRWRETRRTG